MTAAEPLMRGTFTFLFTDIEGSTATEARIGRERYAELRERHRGPAPGRVGGQRRPGAGHRGGLVLRRVPRGAHGHRCRRRGPAGAGRRTVAGRCADPGPDGDQQRRRRADRRRPDGTGGNLVGVAINRAARLAAVAHGGQILRHGPDPGPADRRRPAPASRCATSGSIGSGTSARRSASSRSSPTACRSSSRRSGRSTRGRTTCRRSSPRSSVATRSWTRRPACSQRPGC